MNNKFIFLRRFKQRNYQISLALIKENIANLLKEEKKTSSGKINNNENAFINNIQNNPQKINNKIENFYKKAIYNIFYYKNFRNFASCIEKSLTQKNSLNSNIILQKKTDFNKANDSIAYFSIFIIKDFLNENKHNEIKKYLKILISMINLNIFSVGNFVYILGLFLNIILEIININKNDFNPNKKFSINESPLKIINDIIDSIISYPKEISKNVELLESIIVLFEKFILKSQKLNIILENDIEWLKLLKIKMIKPEKIYLSKNNNNNISSGFDKLINFLIGRYKYQMTKNFYYEIFKNSAIDLNYYLNAMTFIGLLFDNENKFKSEKKFIIKNGFYIVNNTPLVLNDIKFTINEYSLIFSFKISKIEKRNEGESIILLHLFDKNIKNIIKFIINKNNILQIIINEKEWNTNIIINKNEFYLLCLSQKNGGEANLYINSGIEKAKNTKSQKNNPSNCVFYEKKMDYPNFNKKMMSIEIGKNNFSGIIGETIIINKELQKNNIDKLFSANEYYADLLYYGSRKVKNDLIKNKNNFYMTENKSKDFFFNELKYNCLLNIMTYKLNQFLTHKHYFSVKGYGNLSYSAKTQNDLLHFKIIYNNELFLEENGIDFLIFMLHNISSQTSNTQFFNLYLYKTLDVLFKIFENDSDYFYLTKNEFCLLKLKEFFIFLIRILDYTQNDQSKSNFLLDENIKDKLLSFLKHFKSNFLSPLRNLILSILLDNKLFNYKKYLNDLEYIFDYLYNIFSQQIEQEYLMINDEIIYKILSFDYIFELNNIKHKKYTKLLSLLLCLNEDNNNTKINQKHKKICEKLINYILSLQNDIKIYHYLKIIYINLNNCKKHIILNFQFLQYILIKVEKVKSDHCKYCKYIQVLCYLLKKEIFINDNEEDKDKYFKYETTGFMIMPSFDFIKCAFIEYFNMDNKSKLKFIKSNDDNFLKFFEEKKKDFFEVAGYKKFIPRFYAFIKYLAFLQKEYDESSDLKLKQILEKYYSFVLNVIDLIFKFKKNKDFEILMNESKGLENFINLYLKFQKNGGFEKINEYIKITIDQLYNPFYFKLLSLNEKEITKKNNNIDDDDNDKYIRTNIIKNIITELILKEKSNLNNVIKQNIILFLRKIYKNIFNGYLYISQELSRFIISFVLFLINKDFYAIRSLFNVTIYNQSIKKEKVCKSSSSENLISVNPIKINTITNNTSDNIISKKTIKKFILEMIIDICISLYLYQNNGMEYGHFIDSILISKDNCTLFYLSDINYFQQKNEEKHSLSDDKNENQNIKNFSFSIYFLIYFVCKQKEIENLKSLKLIDKILELLFNDLFKLFKNFPKDIDKISKKDFTDEKYIEMYNGAVKIFSNKMNKKNFNLKSFIDELLLFHSRLEKKKIGENDGSFLRNSFFEYEKQPSFEDLVTPGKNNFNLEILGLENNDNECEINNNDSFLEKEKLLNINEKKRSRSFTKEKNQKYRKKFKKLYINDDDNDDINIEDYEVKQYLNVSNNSNQINKTDIKEILNINNKSEIKTTEQINERKLTLDDFINENESNNNILFENINSNNNCEYDIYEKLSQVDIPSIFYEDIGSYIKKYDFIKFLYNPKEYLIWKNFTIIFKDIIFNNKKFKNVSKSFDVYFRKIKLEKSSPNDKKYYLNYPTKIKNYTNTEYCRIFLKPCLNFFKNYSINISHPYINKNLLNSKQYLEDNFSYIEFKRIIPYPTKNKNTKDKLIYCEKFCNKGNIFGYIIICREFLLFINDPTKDLRQSEDLETKLKFIITFKEDIIEDENKYTLIYFKEIKEMFLRRICFSSVGYEIFLKDNRSHLFNFFNKESLNLFIDNINYIIHLEETEENNNNQNKSIFTVNNSRQIINIENNISIIKLGENTISVINKSWEYFEKTDYKQKYLKGEMTSFNYLLLLNKYSSRSYNDYNQYLIFPLLFICIDGEKVKSRDLSKAICLNKEKVNIDRYLINKQLVHCHFNNHYSAGGYVLYYMTRLIPFTYNQIKFQSGRFDLSERMFTSIKNLLSVFSITEENRELIPEIAYDYELYLNLNKNDFGYIRGEKVQINNFNTNIKKNFVEFIFFYRQLLEKQNNLIKWIDNIYGSNQYNLSDNMPNSFPRYSYKEFNDFEKEKKSNKSIENIYEEIQHSIGLFTLGSTPAKIFKSPHPSKSDKIINNINEENDENNISLNNSINIENNNLNTKENLLLQNIMKCIEKNSYEKYNLILFENNIMIKFNAKAEIFFLDNDEKNNQLTLQFKKQIKIQPYRNLFCELVQGFYCFVRNSDKTIQFINKKDNYKYLWTCIPTAVEKYEFEKLKSSGDQETYSNEIFMGDENGFLHLLKIQYDKINDKFDFKITSISIIKSIKTHLGYIKGIIYDKRLNIILSWCNDGIISINNAYSFNCLNMISIGKKYNIKEIKISKYNLIFASCYNVKNGYYYIKCYTLNGIKVTKLKSNIKIIDFFLGEKLNAAFSDGKVKCFNLYDLTKVDKETNYFTNNNLKNDLYAYHYVFIQKWMTLLIIYSNNRSEWYKVGKEFL